MARIGEPQSSTVVGRDVERDRLSELLDAASAGDGGLVLISGEAGIGKTTLVRMLETDARRQGYLVLTGHCYDLSVTPPYGPWREIVDASLRQADLLVPHAELHDRRGFSEALSREVLFRELEAYLTSIAQQRPLVLVLEDLHWAEPGSLDFMRILARKLAVLPLLLLGTFRQDDLAPGDSLYTLIPHLVREANAHRIRLQPLDKSMVRDLVAQRYGLPACDEDRLATYLESRGEGIPFYLLELLRTLEEERRLNVTEEGWKLGDLDNIQVPLLIRQVIDGRLARLGSHSRELLELAAVIGQEVPLQLWQDLSRAGEDSFAVAIEGAVQSRLLDVAPGGTALSFSHALVREALYVGIPLLRRQGWHREIAEALMKAGDAEPDIIAFHLEQALDPRAVEWFVRAGSRVEHIAALTAARHFESALKLMGTSNAVAGERGWLLARQAHLLRNTDPRLSATLLDQASLLALDAHDRLLLAYVKFFRGHTRCLSGDLGPGIADLEASSIDLMLLSPSDQQRLVALEQQGVVPHHSEVDGLLASELAMVGRINEAFDHTGREIEVTGRLSGRGWLARGIAYGLAGKPIEAKRAFRACLNDLAGDLHGVVSGIVLLVQIFLIQLPYRADDLAARRKLAGDAEAAWQVLVRGYGDTTSPRIARLPDLHLEGRWLEARELALSGVESPGESAVKRLISIVSLAHIAYAQGEADLAYGLVHELLPDGPLAEPGASVLPIALALQRVAVYLCVDSGDLLRAQDWLAAHDRWLDWSGAVLGQADGQLAWAHYHMACGDRSRAKGSAERALALASHPRQPLVLLAAHRLLGRLGRDAGQRDLAREHLQSALDLAERCAAPYERARALAGYAELQIVEANLDGARLSLDEARAIAVSLKAAPLVSRIDSILASLSDPRIEQQSPGDLSSRELDVIRRIAAGQSNREIADQLGISLRTVERHITNIYNKIAVSGRAEAIAFAHHHHIV